MAELLSERMRYFRNQIDDADILDAAAFKVAFDRLLTSWAAEVVELESGVLAQQPLPTTLRLAEKLTRLGVTRGTGDQPLLSQQIQVVADDLHSLLGDEGILLAHLAAAGVIARLNELSAWAWSLEEQAGGVVPAADSVAIPIALPSDGNVVDIAIARQSFGKSPGRFT